MALTVRLNPNEIECLKELQEFTGSTTQTGAIRTVIATHLALQRCYDQSKFTLNQVKTIHEKLIKTLQSQARNNEIIEQIIEDWQEPVCPF
jgi:hypothetical protein